MTTTPEQLRAMDDEEIHDAGGLLAEALRATASPTFLSLANALDRLTIAELRGFFETCLSRYTR